MNSMGRLLRIYSASLSLSLSVCLPALAQQPSYAPAGMLNCTMAPSIGFIIAGSQSLNCSFAPNIGPPTSYVGRITTVGIDIGITAGGVLGWAVLMSTTNAFPGVLSGTYVGASADISLVIGGGANILVGGSNSTVALQPLSLEGQAGANLVLGATGLELRLAP